MTKEQQNKLLYDVTKYNERIKYKVKINPGLDNEYWIIEEYKNKTVKLESIANGLTRIESRKNIEVIK